MRALVLILTLFAFSNSAHALRNAAKWKDNCENGGIARACFEYGIWLQSQREQKWKDQGAAYVRRACRMAYTPACDVKPPPVARAYAPPVKQGYVQPQLPTAPVEGNSPTAAVPSGTYIDPSLEDMKDIQQIANYHEAMKKTANGILKKGRGAGFRVENGVLDDEPAAPEGPPAMSVWERAGFRATPLMIKFAGAKSFRVTGTESAK